MLRTEYPRPNMVRERWLSLNGEWLFDFDDDNRGIVEAWYDDPSALTHAITVPFAYQTVASGVNVQEHHPVVWYARSFELPDEWVSQQLFLHFGAVDYEATVWINGTFAGQHRGGYVPFRLEITPLIQPGTNQVVVRVADGVRIDQPRGKQSARRDPWACWYTPVTGIWQSVWIEPLHPTHLQDVFPVPDIDNEAVKLRYKLSHVDEGTSLEAVVLSGDKRISAVTVPVSERYVRWSDIEPVDRGEIQLSVPNPHLWSPEDPHLYDLIVRLRHHDEIIDEIRTYVGMRKVHVENGQFYLNNKPYYQRLVLDQGYWPEGLYTAPSVDAIRKDVEYTKAMGFNGARKHQKIEDPYYYYFCDRIGLLVWSEMPATYEYCESAAKNVLAEWQDAVLRDRGHACIIAWVPINESWGVDQLRWRDLPEAKAHLMAMYYATRALDSSRPVVSNDGWQHAQTDMVTIHEYTQDADDLRRRQDAFFANPYSAAFSHGLPILLTGYDNPNAPILVTEFGGVKVEAQNVAGWGYGKSAVDYDEMAERMRNLVSAILDEPNIVGYCYTQLTDVQQEVNGLLTEDRQFKVDPEQLKGIFRGR